MSILSPLSVSALATANTAVLAAAATENVLPFPPIVFAAISAVVFISLGFVVWSYRDVANRHSSKSRSSTGHGSDHH